MHIKINNVCSKFKLNKHVSLADVQRLFPDAHIVKNGESKFKAVQIKVLQYSATAAVSRSGQVVLVGSKSVEDARETAMFIYTVLNGLGDDDFVVTNIASSFIWNYKIPLPILYYKLQSCVSKKSDVIYEPELGTNCIDLRCKSGMAKIFGTGNMVLTGCRREADIIDTLRNVFCLINKSV